MINRNNFIISTFLLISLLFKGITANSQDSLLNQYVDISKIGIVKPISKSTAGTYIESNAAIEKEYSRLLFSPEILKNAIVPGKYVTKKVVIRFNICNTSDSTVSFYFFPGFYFEDIQLYRVDANELKVIPAILPPIQDSIGYR
ncbi:MAG: hypothetical protein WBC06_03290, partial [Chitinophagaceae bacterium]